MARTHNPFAQVERSKIETPWGEFEIAAPNKERLAAIEALQDEANALSVSVDPGTLEQTVRLGMRTAAAGVERGEELLAKLEEAWDAGEVTVLQIKSLSEFVAEEVSGEAQAGND